MLPIKIKNIHPIYIQQATRGYNVKLGFYCPTHRQFTWEWHEVEGGSRFMRDKVDLICIIAAVLDAYKNAVKEQRELQALPGEWTLDGKSA